MKHLLNFIYGLAVAGGLAALVFGGIAMSIWFSAWVSGGAAWGLVVLFVLSLGILGGAICAIHEATE